MLLVLGMLALTVPVFAHTTATVSMGITATVEKFVIANFGSNVTLTITQTAIEAAGTPTNALSALVPGTLRLLMNTDSKLDMTLNPPLLSGGSAPLATGVFPTYLYLDQVATDVMAGTVWGGTGPVTPPSPWWPASTYYTAVRSVYDFALGPTATGSGSKQGTDFTLGFNVQMKNYNGVGIPTSGTYTGGSLVATVHP